MEKSLSLILASLALLTGCAVNDSLYTTNKVINMGFQFMPDEMRNTHLIAIVAFDEEYVGKMRFASRGKLYTQGIHPDTPEYAYRYVHLNVRDLKGAGWYGPGSFALPTGAAVPDHVPLLKAWDIVEYRSAGGFDTLRNFSRTGEGNMVVKVLCHAQDPDYKKCAEGAPCVGGNIAGYGSTP